MSCWRGFDLQTTVCSTVTHRHASIGPSLWKKSARHRHCSKPSSYTAVATSRRWLDPTSLWGNVSLVFLVSRSGLKWDLNYWTKNESFCGNCISLPWIAWRWYCQFCDAKKKKKSMLKIKETNIKSVRQTSFLSWKQKHVHVQKHVMLKSELCICSWSVASSCSLNKAAGFRECKLLHSTCCYASSETVKNT